jgi:hypothetical protein
LLDASIEAGGASFARLDSLPDIALRRNRRKRNAAWSAITHGFSRDEVDGYGRNGAKTRSAGTKARILGGERVAFRLVCGGRSEPRRRVALCAL